MNRADEMNRARTWDATDPDAARNGRKMFHRVFGTPEGSVALAQLLDDWHYGQEVSAPGDVALRNYAEFFLHERLGITDRIAITAALVDIAIQGV